MGAPNAAVDEVVVVWGGRAVVRVTGEDRRSFLDATLTQAIKDLGPGQARGAMWLDIHGAPLAVFEVLVPVDDSCLLLLTEPAGVEAIVNGLGMRTFLADAKFEATDLEVVAVRRWQPTREPLDAWVLREDGPVSALGRSDGVDLIGPRDDLRRWLEGQALPADGQDSVALRDHAIRSGVPSPSTEIVSPHLPEEAGVLPTHVHLAKGCYPGQEAVARMWMLGKPRRRLVVLDLDRVAETGDEVGQGRQRVTITSVTSQAPWAAMGYAPADVAVGDVIAGPSWEGTVRSIVGDGQDQPGADPAVTRRRDRRGEVSPAKRVP